MAAGQSSRFAAPASAAAGAAAGSAAAAAASAAEARPADGRAPPPKRKAAIRQAVAEAGHRTHAEIAVAVHGVPAIRTRISCCFTASRSAHSSLARSGWQASRQRPPSSVTARHADAHGRPPAGAPRGRPPGPQAHPPPSRGPPGRRGIRPSLRPRARRYAGGAAVHLHAERYAHVFVTPGIRARLSDNAWAGVLARLARSVPGGLARSLLPFSTYQTPSPPTSPPTMSLETPLLR